MIAKHKQRAACLLQQQRDDQQTRLARDFYQQCWGTKSVKKLNELSSEDFNDMAVIDDYLSDYED